MVTSCNDELSAYPEPHLTDHVTTAATLWPRLHQPPPRRTKAHPNAMPLRHLYRLSQTTSPLQLPHHFATHRLVAPSPSTSTTTSTSPRESPPRRHAVATRKTPADDDELGFRLYRLSQTTSPLQLPHHLATHRLVAPSPSTPTTTSTPLREIPAPTPCRCDDGTPNATRKPRCIASNTTRLHALTHALRHHHAGTPHKTPPPAITTRPPLYHAGPPRGSTTARPQHGATHGMTPSRRATTASNSDDDGATGDSGRDGKALVPETMYLIMQ
ncbi:hypothetical protein EDB89DRAFT_1915162 [Lactarius sanguifluus]|nr:hypothetical protein EDB89DRAFT_1915162 [Lactarius sanguifluus]